MILYIQMSLLLAAGIYPLMTFVGTRDAGVRRGDWEDLPPQSQVMHVVPGLCVEPVAPARGPLLGTSVPCLRRSL